jgi:hypothetical protein
MVTVLVTPSRAAGIVNVRVRTPATVPRVPLVAPVKASVPGVTAVPVSVTGATAVAPVKATVRVLVKAVLLAVPAAGVNITL